MARQGKLRIESLAELRDTLTATPGGEFGLLVRGERKVEMEIDAKVVADLVRMLQKAVGNRREDEDY
ncbi:MAG: hypothetical protein EXS16_22050 [Gemmataceae bacterium]|nr:hypothetical protein [Gemmataceae bacterium]